MRRFLLMLTLCSGPAIADTTTTDAYGILPTAEMGARADWAGLQVTSDGNSNQQAAGAVALVTLFVGPKSLVAGHEPGHAVALALDRMGNMVDGADAQLTLGFGASMQVLSALGIAQYLFTPPPVASDFLAGAEIEGVQSARAHYRVTADLASVRPAFVPTQASLMPETFGAISTQTLTDQFGNAVEDGVAMSVLLTDQDGRFSFLPLVVRDGTAHGTILSRDIAGEVNGALDLAGAGADGLIFHIEDMTLRGDVNMSLWAEPGIQATGLQIGPIQTTSGFFVPDGTPAQISIEDQKGQSLTTHGWILDGLLSLTLPISPELAPLKTTLTIAGNVETRVVTLGPRPVEQLPRGAQ